MDEAPLSGRNQGVEQSGCQEGATGKSIGYVKTCASTKFRLVDSCHPPDEARNPDRESSDDQSDGLASAGRIGIKLDDEPEDGLSTFWTDGYPHLGITPRATPKRLLVKGGSLLVLVPVLTTRGTQGRPDAPSVAAIY
jgi:hypothetical protein